jgi:hypothetical protein
MVLVPPSTFHERGEHRFPNVCKTCTASAADRLAVVARHSILSPAHRQTLRIRPPCHLPCLCPVRSLWTKDQIRAGRSVTLAVQRWVLSPEDVTYEPLYLSFLDTFSEMCATLSTVQIHQMEQRYSRSLPSIFFCAVSAPKMSLHLIDLLQPHFLVKLATQGHARER